MDIRNYNLEEKVTEMLSEFQGYEDSEALFNVKHGSRLVQVRISILDEDESDFNNWNGVPTLELK